MADVGGKVFGLDMIGDSVKTIAQDVTQQVSGTGAMATAPQSSDSLGGNLEKTSSSSPLQNNNLGSTFVNPQIEQTTKKLEEEKKLSELRKQLHGEYKAHILHSHIVEDERREREKKEMEDIQSDEKKKGFSDLFSFNKKPGAALPRPNPEGGKKQG